jgi:hypothetical protein
MMDVKHFLFCRTKLAELLDIMTPYLQDRGLRQVQSLVDADEWGVALEQLLGAVVEENLPFPEVALRSTNELAKAMNMEGDNYLIAGFLAAIRQRDAPIA